jgi:hypothetical protein
MGINFGRIAQGLATGYLGAAIKDKESKDNARLEVVKAAGIDYYTNQLPAHKKSEENRAQTYNQLSKMFGSEEAADYFDANGFITGDGKDLERITKMLEDKNIKPGAFKDYIPTSNYSERYKTRQTDFETRFEPVAKTLTMQQGGLGKSTVDGLLTKPEGDITTTEQVTTPAVEPQQIEGTPIMTSGTPEKTETITTEIPRTTADTAMSEFFISKTGVLDIGKTSDIEKAAANFRGFGEGMTTDALGNTTLNIMGNKAVELAAFKSVMNDVAKQYVTEDDKVSLSLTAEAANKKLFDQTQGVIGMDNVSMVEGYNKGTVKGAESYTATGFSADFENSFEGNTKREKILRYISTLGTKSEAQYFAQSFPSNLTFDDGVNIKQFLLTVTQ